MPDLRFRLLPERISTTTLSPLNIRVLIPASARRSAPAPTCPDPISDRGHYSKYLIQDEGERLIAASSAFDEGYLHIRDIGLPLMARAPTPTPT